MTVVVERVPGAPVTRVTRWIFNCYVLHGDTGCVVVDAGLRSAVHDLEPRLGEPVLAITATHGHTDHVGGIRALAARHPAPVHLPARTVEYLDGTSTPRPVRNAHRIAPVLGTRPFDLGGLRDAVTGAFGDGHIRRRMRWSGPQPTALTDGAELPGAPGWTVLAAPGHTDDSVAFWHASSGTLLSGDTVLSHRGRAWITPEAADYPALATTAARLRTLPVRQLLPGHGLPVIAPDVWATLR